METIKIDTHNGHSEQDFVLVDLGQDGKFWVRFYGVDAEDYHCELYTRDELKALAAALLQAAGDGEGSEHANE